jgi:hypothetical protein
MHVQIPHQFSQKIAVERVKKGLLEARPHMKDQVTITKEEWEGNALNFAFVAQGKEITGKLEVTEKEFIVDAKLPLLWRMFEGKIEKMIAEQASGMLK